MGSTPLMPSQQASFRPIRMVLLPQVLIAARYAGFVPKSAGSNTSPPPALPSPGLRAVRPADAGVLGAGVVHADQPHGRARPVHDPVPRGPQPDAGAGSAESGGVAVASDAGTVATSA